MKHVFKGFKSARSVHCNEQFVFVLFKDLIVQYNASNLKMIHQYHHSFVTSIFVSERYLFGSFNRTIYQWDVNNFTYINNYSVKGEVRAFCSTDDFLYAVTNDTMYQWAVSGGRGRETPRTLKLPKETPFQLHVSGRKLFVVYVKSIVVFDLIDYNHKSIKLNTEIEYLIDAYYVKLIHWFIYDITNNEMMYMPYNGKFIVVPGTSYILHIAQKSIRGRVIRDRQNYKDEQFDTLYTSTNSIIDYTLHKDNTKMFVLHENALVAVDVAITFPPRQLPKYEEDREDEETTNVTTSAQKVTPPDVKDCLNDDLITLEKYTKDQNPILVYIQDANDLFKKALCVTYDELRMYLNTMRDTSIPDNIMTLYTKSKIHDDPSGRGSKPTARIVFKMPVNNMYITMGSMKRIFQSIETNRVWYALPLFGGLRRRVGNLKGIFGPSMNHGQIPGYKIYKLFTQDEITKGVIVKESTNDYPQFTIHHSKPLYDLIGETQINKLFVNSLLDEVMLMLRK